MKVAVVVLVDSVEAASALANRLDAEGVGEISIDTGEGYGLKSCPVLGCSSFVYYPDEVNCGEHAEGVKV